MTTWIKRLRERETRNNAEDPGSVLARRLNNSEYDDTIRDLTSVDTRPTREFPVDPANQAGFDNSGESLTMSSALVKKYLAAVRTVADHIVLKPDEFIFAPQSAVADSDRDKYCVQRIVDFYNRHKIDYADYFLAAWQFQHRKRLNQPDASVRDVAAKAGLSAKYLETVLNALTTRHPDEGPLRKVIAFWKGLPDKPGDVRSSCEQMRDLVIRLRKTIKSEVSKLHVKGISDGSQPLFLWRNRQIASRRMRSLHDTDSSDLKEFCRLYPTRFSYPPSSLFRLKAVVSGRLLTAGFHLIQGYFRVDQPLIELVLDEAGRKEIDVLWAALNFVTLAPARQYKDFIFFERAEPPQFLRQAEFDFARSENKDAIVSANISRIGAAYLAKVRKIGASEEGIDAIQTYFTKMSSEIRRIEQSRLASEHILCYNFVYNDRCILGYDHSQTLPQRRLRHRIAVRRPLPLIAPRGRRPARPQPSRRPRRRTMACPQRLPMALSPQRLPSLRNYLQTRRWLAAGCFEAIVHDLRAGTSAKGRRGSQGKLNERSRSMQSFNESSGTLRRFSHRTLCSWAGTVLPLLAPFVIYLVFILCYCGANIQRGLACILNSRLTLASGPKTRIEFGAEGK